MNKQIRKYYRQLKRNLPYIRHTRNLFLRSLKSGINSYLQEYPHASMDEIYAQFGTIEELTEIYMDNVASDTLSHYMIFNRVARYCCVLLVIAFASWCVNFVYTARKSIVTEIEIKTEIYEEVPDEITLIK
ncbi:MAG: hypothetical protein HFH49_08295 [Lachnospiraceae bacterium]|nr:hypothetical protein [Lachnospiraceae bacterium]